MTDPLAETDRQLRQAIAGDGVHVVHVWAPWCDNSLHELSPVWARDTGADSITFVTVWNDGESGADTLRQHGVDAPEMVVPGPKPDKAERRMTLLDLPVTWIPTTWVFNRGGLLATAFSYGEITADRLVQAIADARSSW